MNVFLGNVVQVVQVIIESYKKIIKFFKNLPTMLKSGWTLKDLSHVPYESDLGVFQVLGGDARNWVDPWGIPIGDHIPTPS
jgi:hypothetical protein